MVDGPSTNELPQELYDKIVDAVAWDHPRSLLKSNRLSRRFRARAQLHLYRTVTLYFSSKPSSKLRNGLLCIPILDFITCGDELLSLIRCLTIHTTCNEWLLSAIPAAFWTRAWPPMSVYTLELTGSLPSEGPADLSRILHAIHRVAGRTVRLLDLLRWERAPLAFIAGLVSGFQSVDHLSLEVNVPGSSSLVKMPRTGGHLRTITLQMSMSVPRWTWLFLDTLLSSGWSVDMIFLSVDGDPRLGALDETAQRARIRAARVVCKNMPTMERPSARHGVRGIEDRAALGLLQSLPQLSILHFHIENATAGDCDLAAPAARTLWHRRRHAQYLPTFLVLSMTLRQHGDVLECVTTQDWDFLCDELSRTQNPVQLLVMIAVPLGTVIRRSPAQIEALCRRDVEIAMGGKRIDTSAVIIRDSGRWSDGWLEAAKVQQVIEGQADLRTLAVQ